MKNYYLIIIFIVLIFSYGCSGEDKNNMSLYYSTPQVLDLGKYPASPPPRKLNVLFIHHSCGGQWLADKGAIDCKDAICKSHPNGGGLRRILERNNYSVHEASYNSVIGNNTDIQDWYPKFNSYMNRILKTKLQDELLPENEKNHIVMFKSCFPNNNFQSDSAVEEAKEAYRKLLPILSKFSKTLFVAITAPPLVNPCNNSFKGLLIRFLGKREKIENIGKRARIFNNWLKDTKSGWLSQYPLKNVVVFDYYDILTKEGKSNWAEYPTQGGTNSHPNSVGNSIAAQHLITFLNRAVHRAEIL